MQYTLNGDGQVQVEAEYIPGKDTVVMLPKFGMRMQILADLVRLNGTEGSFWKINMTGRLARY